MNDRNLEPELDLSNCENEPIHIPNKIQPFGFILVVNPDTFQIVQCSKNVDRYLGLSPETILTKTLFDLIPTEQVDPIQDVIITKRVIYINPIDLIFLEEKISFRSTLHLTDGLLIIDNEPIDTSTFLDFYSSVNRLMDDLKRAKTILDMSNLIVTHIRQLTRYDRVMVYEFDKDWNGTVIAESLSGDLYSFLGQHFPASDIPKQARDLYLRNPIRIIPDVNYTPVQIIPEVNPINQKFIDLSKSSLRSVSPIHIEYLQNMGVKSTLVISVIINDTLWGLIACHHYEPKYIDSKMRNMLEHFGNIFSYNVDILQNIRLKDIDIKFNSIQTELIKRLNQEKDFFTGLSKCMPILLQVNSAAGVVLFFGDKSFKEGITPDRDFTHRLIDWLYLTHSEAIVYSDCLSDIYTKSESYIPIASGILAMRLSKFDKNYIIWFKPEMIQSVIWGGNPKEKIIAIPNQDGFRLSPRKSFEKWEEVVKRHSTPWEKSEILFAEKLRNTFQELIANQISILEAQNIELGIIIQEKVLEIKKTNRELQKVSEQIRQQNEKLKIQNENILTLYQELKNHKNQLKAIFDNTKHIIFLLDTEGRLLFFNQVANEISFKLHGRPLTIGDTLKSFARSQEEIDRIEKRFQKAMSGEGFVLEEEVFHEMFNKSAWFRIEYDPVYEEDSLIGVAILMTDVTEIKMAAQKIENQNSALREIAFLQSHRVRRPLANILGLIHVFNQEDLSDPFNKTVLEKLLFSTHELDEVVRSIVDRTYNFDE